MPLDPQNLANGKEQHEYYKSSFKRPGKPAPKLCQYDYRHHDGELFSCVGKSLEDCRSKKAAWIKAKVDKQLTRLGWLGA